MTTQKDLESIARLIVDLKQQHEALSRSAQAAHTSVTLSSGEVVGLGDAAETASDSSALATYASARAEALGDNLDINTEYTVDVPEWISVATDASDVLWDSTQFATDLALRLETELSAAQIELDAAQLELAQALADSATALVEAEEALTEAVAAANVANGKTKVFYQTTMPTTGKLDDVWFDTDDGHRMYRHNGTTFVSAQFGTNSLSDTAVTAGKLANQAVTEAKLATSVQTSITTAQSTANNAQTVANNAAAAAVLSDAAYWQARAVGASLLSPDVAFSEGMNGVSSYRVGGSAGPVTRVVTPVDNPSKSGYIIQVTDNNIGSTNFTGVVPGSWLSRAGAIYLQRFVAKLPTGYRFVPASNPIGDAPGAEGLSVTTGRWLTSALGTGQWQTYLRLIVSGTAGTFQSTGHLYVSGPERLAGDPLTWQLSSMECLDITNALKPTDTLIQSDAPAASYRKSTTLWIDTTGGSNTPKRWNGTTWAVLTDKAAIDAALAAANAQATATAAQTAAANAAVIATAAQTAADAAQAAASAAQTAAAGAQTTANGKNKVVRSTANASAPASYVLGDQWWKLSGAEVVGLWLHDGTAWQPQTLTDSVVTNLNAGSITAGTLNAERIGAGTITGSHISGATVTAANMAAGTITAASGIIAEAAIGSANIINGAITTAKIGEAQITNAKIADATIASAKIAALDAGKITTGTLNADRIGATSITAGKIATNAVTAEKINANAVTTAKLNAEAVNADKLAASAVTADKLAANAVTAAKIQAQAIDGMTITGATVRTAPSGQRVQLDVNGLRTFSATDEETARITAEGGSLSLTGDLTVYDYLTETGSGPGVISGRGVFLDQNFSRGSRAYFANTSPTSTRVATLMATGGNYPDDLALFDGTYIEGSQAAEVSVHSSGPDQTTAFISAAQINLASLSGTNVRGALTARDGVTYEVSTMPDTSSPLFAQGMRISYMGTDYMAFEEYNATTNRGGTVVAGWFPVGGLLPFGTAMKASDQSVGAGRAVVQITPRKLAGGFTSAWNSLVVPCDGWYDVQGYVYIWTATGTYRMAMVQNGTQNIDLVRGATSGAWTVQTPVQRVLLRKSNSIYLLTDGDAANTIRADTYDNLTVRYAAPPIPVA